MIAPSAPYDEVADWYEHDFLVTQRALGVDGFADRLGIDRSLAELLGAGTGTCLEIGCGTGADVGFRGGVAYEPGLLTNSNGIV